MCGRPLKVWGVGYSVNELQRPGSSAGSNEESDWPKSCQQRSDEGKMWLALSPSFKRYGIWGGEGGVLAPSTHLPFTHPLPLHPEPGLFTSCSRLNLLHCTL